MKTVLAIPSGNRLENLVCTILKWRKVCDFTIAVYTWDVETFNGVQSIADYLLFGDYNSFAKNHNFMAAENKDWDVYICGADDLCPAFGLEHIETVCSEYPDKVIWVQDCFLNQQPTHAIITRGWYEKHNSIYDEQFEHNYCDTDLFTRTIENMEIIKCFDIGFDHRHYLRMNKKRDEVYRKGESTFQADRKRYEDKYGDKQLTNGMVSEVPEVKIDEGIVVNE